MVFAEKGELLGARIAADEQWRFPLSDSVPTKFETCLLAKEDRHFYRHPGFNPVSLFRAVYLNIKHEKVVSGGSTISMQVIRLSRDNPPRTVWEKIYEILLATRLELRFSKEEILNLYASHAPFGGNVVGLEAASWRYFGRPAAQLSWAESATLAVLPNVPGLIHPGRNRAALSQKRNQLLKTLWEREKLDETTYQLALLESIPQQPERLPDDATHFTDFLNEKNKGEKIYSTIDWEWQNRANQLIQVRLQKLSRNKIFNGAILLIENETGAIKTYIGNQRNTPGGFNNMLRAPRSSGSILKPFLYASMLQSGEILPDELVPDIPTFFSGFKPENFVRDYDGAVPASEALARSLNIPAVRMLKDFSVPRFQRKLHQLGFSTIEKPPGHYGLSLILGGAEVTAWDLGRAYYQMAAQLNLYQNSDLENKAQTPDIHFIKDEKALPHSPFGNAEIYQTFQVLTTLNRPDSEMGWQKFGSPNVAWKTGTSFGFRDAWAVGVTRKFTCVVWVGNASGEGRPGLIGAQAAGPLLFDFLNTLPQEKFFEPPLDEMAEAEICEQSGLLATRHCETSKLDWIPKTKLSQKLCGNCRTVFTTKNKDFLVSKNCAENEEIVEQKWFVLPAGQAWYFSKKNADYEPLPPWKPDCISENQRLVDVIYPKQNGRVFIPKDLDGEAGKVILEAAPQRPANKLFWHLNGEFIGETEIFHRKAMYLKSGNYALLVEDENGNSAQRDFQVVEKS